MDDKIASRMRLRPAGGLVQRLA